MASINTRPTKRAKITHELPDTLFRYILSFALPPRGQTEHKQKMRAVFTDLTTLNLYNPVENVVTVDGFTMYDDPRIVTMEKYLRQPAVLQTALGGEMPLYRSYWEFDVRFQTTLKTADTMEELLFFDEDSGDYTQQSRDWLMYEPVRNIGTF